MSSSASFYPTEQADDGYGYSSNWWTVNQLYIGDNMGNAYKGFVRFRNVTIPKGSSVTSAKVRLYAYASDSNTDIDINCYFEDISNASQYGNMAAWTAASKTDAVNWDMTD